MGTARVVWITQGFPHGHGEQFIAPELRAWDGRDVRVTMMPVQLSGGRRPMPDNFVLDESLARAWSSRRVLAGAVAAALADPRYRRELADLRRRGALGQATARRALNATAQAVMVERAVMAAARREGAFDLAYTYWLKPYASGALAARGKGQVGRVVSRAHGTDVYEHARPLQYNPLVRTELLGLDAVFPISEQGAGYLVDQYGFAPEVVHPARLGVDLPDEAAMAPCGAPDELDLVTVSSLTPLKRMDLVVRSLAAAAPRLGGRTIRWRHFGDGPLRSEVEALAHELLDPLGVGLELRGQLGHDELLQALSGEPADLMLNLSSSEGVPVSIMETAARGIPCLATDVGATVEVVGEGSSYLLDANPTAEQVAQRIVELADDCRSPQRRGAVRALVAERFDATRNFTGFVDELLGAAR